MKPVQDIREARFEYRCRRCGELYVNPCCDIDMARLFMRLLRAGEPVGSGEAGGRVYMFETHQCVDGGEGLADLIGYRVAGTPAEIASRGD